MMKGGKQDAHEQTPVFKLGDADEEQTRNAQQVVRDLYHRYDQQIQRWVRYRNLFGFLGFVALLLATLYLQRSANTAYQVYATVQNVVDPQTTTMPGIDDVYGYLENLIQTIWVDPICGDGICEVPFEYASYGSFGCQADCGQLTKKEKLTKLSIDLYYDFSHPTTSTPSYSLMQQVTWNLCPQETQYSTACYFSEDQTFSQITGSVSMTVNDAPDGVWDLIVKRDVFNKVQGSVRSSEDMYTAALYYKIVVAALAAQAEQNYELQLLTQARAFSEMPFWQYVHAMLVSDKDLFADTKVAGMQNATCLCYNTNVINTTQIWGDTVLLHLNQSADAMQPGRSMTQNFTQYEENYCNAQMAPYVLTVLNATSGNHTLRNISRFSPPDMEPWCQQQLDTAMRWRLNMTGTVRSLLTDFRLGNSTILGKVAARRDARNQLYQYLQANMPEMINPIFNQPRGTNGYLDPISAQVSILENLYVTGYGFSALYEAGSFAPADSRLSRARVNNPNITLVTLGFRANARMWEIRNQTADTMSIKVVGPNFNFTVGEIMQRFGSASVRANISQLPWSTDPGLEQFAVVYNQSFWQGNSSAYMMCDLEARAPEYVGTCVDMEVTCMQFPNNASHPFVCNYIADGRNVTGDVSDPFYRRDCQIPCDMQLDMRTLCECYGTCGSTQYCSCPAYDSYFRPDAKQEDKFLELQNAFTSSGTLGNASVADPAPSRRFSRRLAQSTNLDTLSIMLADSFNSSKDVQTGLDAVNTGVQSLSSKLDTANTLAQARAGDNTLVTLIKAANAQIKSGQEKLEEMLQQIIGQQEVSLAAANAAASALANIQALQQQQQAAQAALETAVNSQILAVKTAATQGTITLQQALLLWVRVRRSRVASIKAALLANTPCTQAPTIHHVFTLNNSNTPMPNTVRERNIGLTNRVIAGMLLHQTRSQSVPCPKSRFNEINNDCRGGLDTEPYGIDPVFKSGTNLYNPDYDDGSGDAASVFYNCSALPNATQNVYDSASNLTHYPRPNYCAELFNIYNVPYAFHSVPLPNKPIGYPVWVDINLDNGGATNLFDYVKEGLYLDENTDQLTSELITYNPAMSLFSYFNVKFRFDRSGYVDVKYSLYVVDIELYRTYDDSVRYGMEILVTIFIVLMCAHQLYGCIQTQIKEKNFLLYFASAAHSLDAISNGLMLACMIMWWRWVNGHANTFNIDLRYDVYQEMNPGANFLALTNDGAELVRAWRAFDSLSRLIDGLTWYCALSGISILLLIARVLARMNFQLRLGVVTRSLWVALPDLLHFAVVGGIVFLAFSMMFHVIFGNQITAFQTFADAVNTCFIMLLGVVDVQTDLMNLNGMQLFIGQLFFWTYMWLVYMVMLNFLLAIIVDAFSAVKEQMGDSEGVHTEVMKLIGDKLRSMWGMFSSTYISDNQLASLLKQWAGGDEQPKEEIKRQKTFKVKSDKEVKEEDLAKVLMTMKKVQEHTSAKVVDNDDEEAGNEKAIAQAKARVKASDVMPDLNQAVLEEIARFMVDRFGKEEHAGGEDEEKEGKEEKAIEKAEEVDPAAAAALAQQERDQLVAALEKLAEVQRELAAAQRSLAAGQQRLAEQQAKLIDSMGNEASTSG